MIEVYVIKEKINIEVRTDMARFETSIPCTLEALQNIERILHKELTYIQRSIRGLKPIDVIPMKTETTKD